MAKIVAAARKFLRRTEGASLVEYALALALVAIVTLAAISSLGESVNTLFGDLKSRFDNAMEGP